MTRHAWQGFPCTHGRDFAGALALSLLVAAAAARTSGRGAPGGGEGGPPGGGMPPMPVEAIDAEDREARCRPADRRQPARGRTGRRASGNRRPHRAHPLHRRRPRRGGTAAVLAGFGAGQRRLNEAAANLANSHRAEARTKELVGQKLIAQSDYDTARAQHGVDEARVESARTALSKMTLRAPFSGQVGLRSVSVGEFVDVGQDLVHAGAPGSDRSRFQRAGKRARAAAHGPEDLGHRRCVPRRSVRWRGGSDRSGDRPDSRSAKLRAQIPNPDGRLRPGQFAQLQLDTGGAGGEGVLVPEQALLQDGNVRYVYTVVDGKAHRVEIKTGLRVPGKVQVVEGLKAGDVVITSGQTKPIMHEGLGVQVDAGRRRAAAPARAEAAAQPRGQARAGAAAARRRAITRRPSPMVLSDHLDPSPRLRDRDQPGGAARRHHLVPAPRGAPDPERRRAGGDRQHDVPGRERAGHRIAGDAAHRGCAVRRRRHRVHAVGEPRAVEPGHHPLPPQPRPRRRRLRRARPRRRRRAASCRKKPTSRSSRSRKPTSSRSSTSRSRPTATRRWRSPTTPSAWSRIACRRSRASRRRRCTPARTRCACGCSRSAWPVSA